MRSNRSCVLGLLVAGVLFSSSASAEVKDTTFSTAISQDGNIVFAVRPYFTKEDKRIFTLGTEAKSVPIGVLIQNYGKEKIYVERIFAASSKHKELYIPKIVPFGKRPLGAIAEIGFFEEASEINKNIHDSYAPNKKLQNLGMNEIFYKPCLEPGESFYGLVYLQKRGKFKHYPSKISHIDNIDINISYLNENLSRLYVAKLSLSENKTGQIEVLEEGTKCENKDCRSIDPKASYRSLKSLDECYARSLADNGKFLGHYYGEHSSAKISFDNNGDYVSRENLISSKRRDVERTMDEVIKGMAHCEISASKDPVHSLTISVGDSFMVERSRGKK